MQRWVTRDESNNHTEAATVTLRPETLRRIGLLAGLCGIPLVLVGVGTAFDYLCCQSHPVPAAVAFSLKLEYTAAGILLLFVGFGLVLLPPLSFD